MDEPPDGDNGRVTPAADPQKRRAHELADRRAHLLGSRDRHDAELARLTEGLLEMLRGPADIHRLRLGAGGSQEDLARRLAALEPVNPVTGEEDLLNRFDRDRRVFVLEHPALAGRPISVVWVALRRGLPDRLADILNPAAPTLDPTEADTAVFYSIWNAEPGLVGLGGGRELLEGVPDRLRSELPGLTTQVTLSPVPGLRSWLRDLGLGDDTVPPDIAGLCARYLVEHSARGRLTDPVARFHLGNGARLLRVCPNADGSPLGRSRAWGTMANYRYLPEDLVANRAELAKGDPAIGEQVRGLIDED